jgi:hypothetical protein
VGDPQTSIPARQGYGTVRPTSLLDLIAQTGPEAPPDENRSFFAAPVGRSRPLAAEKPIEAPAEKPAVAPTEEPVVAPAPAPDAAGPDVPRAALERTVIVLEPEPRRSWGLWVLTAVLVALTAGVMLGETVAFPENTRHVVSQAAPVSAGYSTPPDAVPPTSVPPSASAAPSQAPLAVTGKHVFAPLGAARTRRLDVRGISTQIAIRSVDLCNRLYDIATLDGSAVPKMQNLSTGPQLDIARTGQPGRIGAEILLNSRVRWTLRLVGGAAEQDIDMRSGGLAGVELIGGASRAALWLPEPKGTVGVKVTGGVSELDVYRAAGLPVRTRLGRGADDAVVDGRARRRVKAGTVLTSTGWTGAANRYDVTVQADLTTLRVESAPRP